MTRTTAFKQIVFGANRWNVGHQSPCSAVSPERLEKELRRGERRANKFRKHREHAAVQKVLMATHPFCSVCGHRLQTIDHTQATYASVISPTELSCQGSVHVVQQAQRIAKAMGKAVKPC